MIQSHDSSKRLSRGDMSVETAHANAGHSATMAKFRVVGSHADGVEQNFRVEGVGLTETNPAFFNKRRIARNRDGSKRTPTPPIFTAYTGSRSPLAQFS